MAGGDEHDSQRLARGSSKDWRRRNADAGRVAEAPRPGDEMGVYRLLEELGTGGMGRVFLAEHTKLGRRVAIKILQPELWQNRRSVQRFFQEARLVNRIDHENIVQIYDYVQEPEGLSYFVMELLLGEDLTRNREKHGCFKLARTVRILRQMAEGLSAAHSQGVVHRDLKPGNIFLATRPGRKDFVKLLDFGIAKLQDDVDVMAPHTRTGSIVGTPLYMSPEQAAGEQVDARSDLYSLGVVAFWMLSDAFPYKAKSFAELVVKQQSSPPAALPRTTPSGEPLPAELVAIIERCLQRDKKQRFQTAAELVAAFDALAAVHPAVVGTAEPMSSAASPVAVKAFHPPRKPARLLLGIGVAAGFALAAAGVEYLVWMRAKPSHPPAAAVVAAPPHKAPVPVAAQPPTAPHKSSKLRSVLPALKNRFFAHAGHAAPKPAPEPRPASRPALDPRVVAEAEARLEQAQAQRAQEQQRTAAPPRDAAPPPEAARPPPEAHAEAAPPRAAAAATSPGPDGDAVINPFPTAVSGHP